MGGGLLQRPHHRLTFDLDKIGFQGTYKLTNGLSIIEEGVFHSVPNNPAIGFAAVTLVPDGGQAPRSFVVSGMFTDNEWKIYVALQQAGAQWPAAAAVLGRAHQLTRKAQAAIAASALVAAADGGFGKLHFLSTRSLRANSSATQSTNTRTLVLRWRFGGYTT